MEKGSLPFVLRDLLAAQFNAARNEPLPEKLVLLIDQLRKSDSSPTAITTLGNRAGPP